MIHAQDHVGPDHVLRRILRDEDAEPAADGDDVEDTGNAVHDVLPIPSEPYFRLEDGPSIYPIRRQFGIVQKH